MHPSARDKEYGIIHQNSGIDLSPLSGTDSLEGVLWFGTYPPKKPDCLMCWGIKRYRDPIRIEYQACQGQTEVF